MTNLLEQLPYTITLDDDLVICKLIEDIVGLKTFSFSTATELLQNKHLLNPIGVFVDIHLANEECGLDFIPEITKNWPSAPVIVMTSDTDGSYISQALNSGAHDFILKPLRAQETVARLNARREELQKRNDRKQLVFGDVTFDRQYKTLSGPNGKKFMSPREQEILTFFIGSNGSVIKKNDIKRHVWGSIAVSDNALDRKIFEVRKAIKSVSNVVELKSIYSKGLILQLKNYNEDKVLLDDMELKINRVTI